jgi:diaminohydroxyphosphoribosylaminopyrimidine deaminase/5-amino-6-(5-phosphoribosylamino)uracil reductase
VGAVIVKGRKVIATGFHARAGTPHAEAIALAAAGERARGATLYSTLEPCDHQGRTPPCTEAIIARGVARVVFGSNDPNPLVNGKGLRRLRKAGVVVEGGVLKAATDALNKPFFKSVTTGLPFVTLKAGITLDGKLATASGESKWITSEAAREAAHRLRNRVDAVIVGAGTVLADDPRLTTRLEGGRTPVRVVLDATLSSPSKSQLFDVKAGRVIVATTALLTSRKARALLSRGVEVWSFPAVAGLVPLETLLRRLDAEGLLHVLVEGGASTHAAFLAQGLADEVLLYVAPKLFGHGGLTWSGMLGVKHPEDALKLGPLEVETLNGELVIRASVLQQR